jgi:predicted nucleic acid-binding protein
VTVVSNTSPILNLTAIGEAGLLEKLYPLLLVPSEVAVEIQRLSHAQPRFQSAHLPAFAEVATLQNPHVAIALVGELDQGEAAAIALAVEKQAGLLLMDELRGRTVARRFGIPTLGLLGILKLAKPQRVVPLLAPLLEKLEQEAGFWVGSTLRERVLREAGEA